MQVVPRCFSRVVGGDGRGEYSTARKVSVSAQSPSFKLLRLNLTNGIVGCFCPDHDPVNCRNMFRNYLAVALRNLARNRLYAAINIVGLAVGFCAALLIVLYVRSEYSYDHFFPGYRDVYLLTSYREVLDARLTPEPQDTTFPDVAAKLSTQFRQIESLARVMIATNPLHLRHGPVEADETGFLWVDPSFFRVVPLVTLAGNLQTALATPDSVVLTRTAARKYFGRD